MSMKSLTPEITNIINTAKQIAQTKMHAQWTPEHLLRALIDAPKIRTMLQELHVDIAELNRNLDESLGLIEAQIIVSSIRENTEVENVIASAGNHAKSEGRDQAGIGHVFLGLWQAKASKALLFLQRHKLEHKLVVDWFTKANEIGRVAVQEPEEYDARERATAGGGQHDAERGVSALAKYCTDLTALARDGKLDPMIGRKKELASSIQTLCRKRKNNPVLVGEAGVGKTAIVEGLAQAIADKTVPELLQGKRIMQLDLGALTGGTTFRGEFELRLITLLKEIDQAKDIILFIDEIHNLIGAGRASDSAMDAANIMKPALARGNLSTIGATTNEEYRKYIEKDKPLARRFQPVQVEEPTIPEVHLILERITPNFASFHQVEYAPETLDAAVKLTARYLPNRKFPDKAIDAVDDAGSIAKLARRKMVTLDDLQHAVAASAKLPPEAVNTDETEVLARLGDNLKKKVFDQDEAVHLITRKVQTARAGLGNPEKPIGSYLFAGPTGVGKTELSKALAHELNIPLVRLDMSEYAEKTAVARLTGASPGYVGFEQGGVLTNAVDKTPHCILLLDEIEKAHADVFDTLLQVMDYGKLTDGQGRQTDFRNVILIMTSNCGVDEQQRGALGFGRSNANNDNFAKALRSTFKKEFINRLTDVIKFASITPETTPRIVQKFLDATQSRLAERKVSITVSEAAMKKLAELAYDPEMGARPAERVVANKIDDPLGQLILFGGLRSGGTALIDLDEAGEITVNAA